MTPERGEPVSSSAVEFDFAFHPMFALAAKPFGVRRGTSVVRVGDDEIGVDYGPWRLRTAVSNVRAVSLAGPYSWPKVVGPAHLSFSDRGITFASNPDCGVYVEFHEPVTGIDPWGLIRHPNLTITVARPESLAALLSDLRDLHPRIDRMGPPGGR